MAQIFLSGVMFLFGMCFLISANCQENSSVAGMIFIGTAISGFNPCPDSFILMERESGRSPSTDNYWKGTFDFSNFTKLNELKIEMKLDSDAVITVDGEDVKVSAKGKSYIFTSPVIPNIPKYLKFEVNAPANKPFPNIVSVLLNGQQVCENPKSWHPQIQEVADQAKTGNESTPSTESAVKGGA